MHGPYLFKKGFGGTVTQWVGAHDAVPRPLGYRAFLLLEPAYTRALQLARGRGRAARE
jgi:lipid II:glycine glycyltransferase (peptidoglycan interpeptide bridge formation enzyme)